MIPKREDGLSKEGSNPHYSSKASSRRRPVWLLSEESQLDQSQKNLNEVHRTGL